MAATRSQSSCSVGSVLKARTSMARTDSGVGSRDRTSKRCARRVARWSSPCSCQAPRLGASTRGRLAARGRDEPDRLFLDEPRRRARAKSGNRTSTRLSCSDHLRMCRPVRVPAELAARVGVRNQKLSLQRGASAVAVQLRWTLRHVRFTNTRLLATEPTRVSSCRQRRHAETSHAAPDARPSVRWDTRPG